MQIVEHGGDALHGVLCGHHARGVFPDPGLGGRRCLSLEEGVAVLRQLSVELVDLALDERLAGLVDARVRLEALDLVGKRLNTCLVARVIAVSGGEALLEVVLFGFQGLYSSAVGLVRVLRLGLVLLYCLQGVERLALLPDQGLQLLVAGAEPL